MGSLLGREGHAAPCVQLIAAITAAVGVLSGCSGSTETGSSRPPGTGDASTAGGGATASGGATAGGATGSGGTIEAGGNVTTVTGGRTANAGGSTTGGAAQAGAGGRAATGGAAGTGGLPDAGQGGADSGACSSAVFDGPCTSEGSFCGSCPDACSFCNVLRCSNGKWSGIEGPPAPCFDCGASKRCQTNVDYCDITHSDVGGVPDTDACLRLPSSCRGSQAASCTCLPAALSGDRCTTTRPGEIVVEHLGG